MKEAASPPRRPSSLDLKPLRAFLDESHLALAERARTHAARTIAPLPAPESDDAARAQARRILPELGLAGMFTPIEALDSRGCCVVRESLAAASPLADAVFALQALGTTPLLLAGAPAHARWAKDAIRGAAMSAFAMTEADAGSDAGALKTRARREGDAWILDGSKTLISNGGLADFYVTFASTGPAKGSKGVSAFLVPASAPGLTFVRPLVMSAPHPLGEISFEACRIPADSLVGELGGGMKLGLATLDRLRASVGAAACGMAGRALDEAIAHASSRQQFGKPIADFQLIQDKIARMAMDLRAARFLVFQAAWEKDQGAERVTLESGMAKAFATEAAQRIVDGAVQIIGGRGVLADHVVDRLYRSVRSLRIYEGTTEIQHLLIAGQILAAHRTPA